MQIFIHFGLHKTGTTFLQQNVFPKFSNIILIRSSNLIKQLNTIFLSNKNKVLISNEGLLGGPLAGNWLKNHKIGLKNISKIFPYAKIIIAFREHNNLLISLYKQYLQEGGTKRLEGEFFDIENDSGIIKKQDLLFYERIVEIEKYFKEKPFVFKQEELKMNFPQFLYDISKFLNEDPPDIKDIDFTKKNIGVRFYQAKILRNINIFLNYFPLIKNIVNSYIFRGLRIYPRYICQNRLQFISKKDIKLSGEYQKYICENYNEDWQKINNYIWQTRG